MARNPRQHYISKFLMENWADDDGQVGVVCMHHRNGAIVSAEKLHWLRNLSSLELESEWDGIENRAKHAIDRLETALGLGSPDLGAAEQFLAAPGNLTSLVDLAVLHHARSLIVPLEQYFNGRTTLDSAASEATIQRRWDNASGYHDCGIVVTVVQSDTPSALGAVPVFDTENWGGPMPGTGRFVMPLTPRVVITGIPKESAGLVEVVSENLDPSRHLTLSIAGEPGQFHTPFLICEPSALEQTTNKALAITEGSGVHWHAVHNRLHTYVELIPSTQRNSLLKTAARYEANQGIHGDPTTTYSRRAKLRAMMIEDAREVQTGLDNFNVPICACSALRADEHAGLWKSFMPQIICDAMR